MSSAVEMANVAKGISRKEDLGVRSTLLQEQLKALIGPAIAIGAQEGLADDQQSNINGGINQLI